MYTYVLYIVHLESRYTFSTGLSAKLSVYPLDTVKKRLQISGWEGRKGTWTKREPGWEGRKGTWTKREPGWEGRKGTWTKREPGLYRNGPLKG